MRCTMPGACATGRGARVLEEGQVGAAAAELVGVEQVVHARIVLVDRLLDHPHAEHACVEIHVPGRVARDRRDVVDALEPHPRAVYDPSKRGGYV